MQQYQKIPAIYRRSEDGKRVLFGEYSSPELEYLKDLEWYFTEKIDGTNIRVYWDGHKVSFGGRTERAVIQNHLLEYLQEKFGTPGMEQVFEQHFGDKEVILFGEGYGVKIQKNGGDYSPTPKFILFDVMVNGTYLERLDVEKVSVNFDTETVPIVLTGDLNDAVNYVSKNPASKVAQNAIAMEGVVGTPVIPLYNKNGKRIIVKIRTCDV